MLSEKASVDSEGGSGGLKAKLAARFKKRSEDSPEKKKQLQDYTAWVNNYLRRKPGAPLVTNLRWNLGDGITFVHLVEIVTKAQIAGVERWPSTVEGRRLNTERVLEFLQADGVVLHQDACRDLQEGSVKGVMKVILAIAERYQPKSVKPRSAPEPTRPSNHTAPVLIPDTNLTRQDPIRPYTQPHTVAHPAPPPYQAARYPSSGPYPGPESVYSSPIDELPADKPPQVISSKKKAAVVRSRTTSLGMAGLPEEGTDEWEGPGSGGGVGGMVRVEERADLTMEIGTVVTGLSEFKAELLQLHAILLRNNDGVRDVGGATVEGVRGETSDDRVAREKEREKLMQEIDSLREKLSQMQDECTQVEAECGALRNMVEERNAFITTMKSEIYRKEYLNETHQAELHTQLLHKDTHIKKLEADLESCHSNLEAAETELGTVRGDLEQSRDTAEQNQAKLEQLQSELVKVSASEEKTSQRLSAKEKKLLTLEERLTEEKERGTRRMQQLSDDMDALAEGLAQLSAESAPPDQLEPLQKIVVDMAAKLDNPANTSPTRRRRRDQEDHSRHRRKRRDRQEPHPPATPTSPNTTRVMYYMAGDSKSEAPFVAIVPKKASEVTLRDFKAAFGRHGDYRYFFKTEDPDCGVVKEELTGDDQLLPTLKGKVTAWIREAEISTATTTQ